MAWLQGTARGGAQQCKRGSRGEIPPEPQSGTEARQLRRSSDATFRRDSVPSDAVGSRPGGQSSSLLPERVLALFALTTLSTSN